MHTQIYDKTMMEGNSVLLSYGSYTNSQLTALITTVQSISIPPHVMVTIYSGDNFLGNSYVMSNTNTKFLQIPGFYKEFPYTVLSLTIQCACSLPANTATITTNTFTNGTQILGYSYYNTSNSQGPIPNPTIVIIGDFGIPKSLYAALQDNLASRNYSSLILDPRGVGSSSSATSNTYANTVQDYRYALGQLLIIKPIVIGHGFGGAIAQLWALSYRLELLKLILIDSASYAIYNSYNKLSTLFTNWTSNIITTNEFATQLGLTTYNTSSDECQPPVLQLDLLNAFNTSSISTLKLFLTQNTDNIALEFAPKLIKIPVLIIVGLKDEYINVKGSFQLLHLIKNSRLVKLNTCHAPQFTRTIQTYSIIYDFIRHL